jgi:hypothetical protein
MTASALEVIKEATYRNPTRVPVHPTHLTLKKAFEILQ